MEAPAELLAALPALATALALLLAWLLVRRGVAASPGPAGAPPEPASPVPASPRVPEPAAAPGGPGLPEGPGEPTEPGEPVAAPAEAEEQAAEARQEEEQDSDSEKYPPLAGPEDEDGETFSFKYSPGQLRGDQYKKMMTKEELEEEQRVQKEQLAAIFKLMKDNKETFGEMSDGDVQEQLRLYDM
ncbi:matrix-remodeling-associated protein 7 isoform 1-T2 [Callospermophilus lateralis]|uniref:matrix-remodeling-associated protein 7 isoform X1 n=1 Tax=Callospermophilus lateralis TaxID=76772 RepID=UPI004038CC07